MDLLARQARDHGLIILAGAGVSMLPPTSLPSWWDFNAAVLSALAKRLADRTNRWFAESRLEELLARRNRLRSFTPDFMAQLMEEESGLRYFEVLQALDAERFNENHLSMAALAKAGVLRAIVTTNFDRLIERALSESGVAHRVFATSTDFELLPAALQDTRDLLVIKAHGSVEKTDSMVDTLAQRVAGRPQVLEGAIASLIRRHACLVVAFRVRISHMTGITSGCGRQPRERKAWWFSPVPDRRPSMQCAISFRLTKTVAVLSRTCCRIRSELCSPHSVLQRRI